ncbi:MAG: hypothetical protein D6775_11860 [Caldilineae bacterium]|nr:MAG: hypothetical protein D6775_11860 [Caldilineae bacterium]
MVYVMRLSDFDPTLLLRQTVAIFRHAWRRQAGEEGIPGITAEALASLAHLNVFPFFVEADGLWTADDISDLLAKYGIKVFGVYRYDEDLVFYVRIGQANFAQWLMERAGVPLKHRVLAARVGKKRRRGRRTRPDTAAEGWGEVIRSELRDLWSWLDSLLR